MERNTPNMHVENLILYYKSLRCFCFSQHDFDRYSTTNCALYSYYTLHIIRIFEQETHLSDKPNLLKVGDITGLIIRASEGKGSGNAFLSHIVISRRHISISWILRK